MKIIFYLYLGLVFFTVLFSSCYYEKDCDTSKFPKNKYSLSEDSKIAFAYKGGDTIRFLKNNVDTILYNGGGIDTFFRESVVLLECDGDIRLYEGYKTLLNSLNGVDFTVILQSSESNPSITGISILYDKASKFFLDVEDVKGPPDIDSMIVNGKKYYNVFVLLNGAEEALYYNIDVGIIRLLSQGNKLEIL